MKLIKFIQFFILIFLPQIGFISTQNDCIVLTKNYTSFQSALKFKFYKIRKQSKKTLIKEYFIKETFHRNKGKLEIDFLESGSKKIYIFDFDQNELYEQFVDSNICKSSKIESLNKPRQPLGNFDIRNENQSLIGPTALINRLINQKSVSSHEFKLRGIDAVECEFNTKSMESGKSFIQTFYLTRLKNFTTETEPVLNLKFEKKIEPPFYLPLDVYESEYFYLKVLDDNQDLNFDNDESPNDFWYVPDYCVNKLEDNVRPPYEKEIKMPKQYELRMQKIVDEQQTTQIKSSVLFADTENKVIRLKGSQTNFSLILDLKNRIEYKLNLEQCNKNFNGKYENLEEYEDSIEIMNRLKKFTKNNYIGQRNCRGLVCDTFSFYSSVDSLEDIIEEEENETNNMSRKEMDNFHQTNNLKDNFILYTIYLHYDGYLHHLIQFKRQLLSQNDARELISTVFYEIYDFKNMEHNYGEIIDLTDCSYEDEHKIEIRLTGLAKENLDYRKKNRLEEETILRVKEISGQTHYNIRKMETIVGEKSLAVSLKLIQPINDLFYYEKFDRYTIPLANLNEPLTKKNLEECASLAKENEWLGFQICPDELCYSIKEKELFELSDVENDEYEMQCVTNRQITNFKSKEYLTIPKSIKLIEKSIEDGKLRLENELIFKSLEDEHEVNQIDKENQFNLIQDKKCFNSKKLNDILKCKLKSRPIDCRLTCETMNCNMFSVRKLAEHQWQCCFIEQTLAQFEEQYKLDDRWSVGEDEACSIYELSYLNKFSRLTGKTIDSKPFKSFVGPSVDDCAVECLKVNKNDKSKCLSFSYCLDRTKSEFHCDLRIYNRFKLDASSKLVNSRDCTLYSANFLIDYHKINFNELTNFTLNEDYDLQECAKQCKHKDECSKFNFCHDKGNQICLLETNGTTILDHPKDSICTSYLKNEHLILDDLTFEPTKKLEQKTNHSIYVYIGCLFLGLKIGSALVLARRVAFCGMKKKFCGNLYVKFKQEEDAISIGRTSQLNEEESSKRNPSQNEDKIKIEKLNEESTETDEGIYHEQSV